MAVTLAFDVYGTLVDTAGIAAALEPFAGGRTAAFAGLWRDKQLEYSFRRGLMQNYCTFADCTRQALDFCCRFFGVEIAAADRDELMARYRLLPPFADVEKALPRLAAAGFRLYAFSNGRAEDVASLFAHAGIGSFFIDIVSTDEIRSFKPNPAVYAHFLRRAAATGEKAWLVSGNPFDVIGAVSAGLRGAWVQRSAKALFDPWEIEPTIVVNDIAALAEGIAGAG
jgi:2-haloacid dehalogenase